PRVRLSQTATTGFYETKPPLRAPVQGSRFKVSSFGMRVTAPLLFTSKITKRSQSALTSIRWAEKSRVERDGEFRNEPIRFDFPTVSVDFYTVSRGNGGLAESLYSIFTKRTHSRLGKNRMNG